MQGDGEKRKRQLLARHAFISVDDGVILKSHTKTN